MRVHQLKMANVRYLDGRINVYAYLIVSAAAVVLVDTGVGTGNRYIDKTFDPKRHDIADELARFGLQPGDVDALVSSHLHFDHIGNNQLFAHAEVYVQSAELEAARASRYTVNEWFDHPGVRLQIITGDLQICPGVTLLSTPGHTPGHQSVLVATATGPVLVAAQAAYTAGEFLRGGDPETQAHPGLEADYRSSIQRLDAIAATEIWFSHDPDPLCPAQRA